MTTRKHRTTLVSFSLLLMATAHARNTHQQPTELMLVASTTPALQINRTMEATHDSSQVDKTEAVITAVKKLQAPQPPLNAAAAKFVDAYIKKNSESLQKIEQRSASVFRIMEPILLKYDLPAELKYLAVVESDLKLNAVSRVGAAGPWQLMPTTARELGLHVSRKRDERKQYVKSTNAAALYLRDLYKYYGDWLLVIAAYNAGPGVVNKAIQRAGSRNFWRLQGFLPAETRGHVKRFIGTHYFFEDGGSETTLTKAEMQTYDKALSKYMALEQKSRETIAETEPSPDTEKQVAQVPVNDCLVPNK
jgi:membrane-bound lytic murein transglycosylase D